MPGVSKISPPMRIVLGVAVAFLAVYMVALRPKTAVTPPPPAPAAPAGNVNTGKPAVTSLGRAVEKAKGAVAATTAQQTAEGKAAGVVPETGSGASATATKPATATATKAAPAKPVKPARPAIDTVGLPAPVAKAIQERKVLALLFTDKRSADDRAVDSALRSVHRFDKRVYTQTVPLASIAKYGRITRGADVQQSPTVVVVDRDLKATPLVGYTDAVSIEQAVVDAMRASGGIFADDRYLAQLNKSCSSVAHDLAAMPQAMTGAQSPRALRSRSRRFDGFVSALKGDAAPARWRGLKHSFVADAVTMQSALHTALAGMGRHPSSAKSASLQATYAAKTRPAGRHMAKLADRHHLIYCGRLG
jgi:hypothetical protein